MNILSSVVPVVELYSVSPECARPGAEGTKPLSHGWWGASESRSRSSFNESQLEIGDYARGIDRM